MTGKTHVKAKERRFSVSPSCQSSYKKGNKRKGDLCFCWRNGFCSL